MCLGSSWSIATRDPSETARSYAWSCQCSCVAARALAVTHCTPAMPTWPCMHVQTTSALQMYATFSAMQYMPVHRPISPSTPSCSCCLLHDEHCLTSSRLLQRVLLHYSLESLLYDVCQAVCGLRCRHNALRLRKLECSIKALLLWHSHSLNQAQLIQVAHLHSSSTGAAGHGQQPRKHTTAAHWQPRTSSNSAAKLLAVGNWMQSKWVRERMQPRFTASTRK